MSILGDRLLAIHDALAKAGIAHAFGGAIALAYCTEEPRGTRDIDVNVFARATEAVRVTSALPKGVTVTPADLAAIARDDQVRLWWDDTPVDLFFDVHDFHQHVATLVRTVAFEDRAIPVLDCDALVVFKAMFNRTRDWADIEAMAEAGTMDADHVLSWLDRLIGSDDDATVRLRNLIR
jgi:hypothetical protein